MASWNQLMQQPSYFFEHLRETYGDNFPLEIRQYLSDFLVSRIQFKSVTETDFQQEAADFLNDLLLQLNTTVLSLASEEYITIRIRLQEAERNLRQLFSHNPVQLCSHLRKCFQMEQQMLNNPDQYFNNESNEPFQTTQALENLTFNVRAAENANRNLKSQFENFYIKYDELVLQKPENPINNFKQEQNEKINYILNDLKISNMNLIVTLKSIIEEVKGIQANVIDNHLSAWKINQKHIANGAIIKSSINLEVIQRWFESLATILWTLQEQIKMMMNYQQQFPVPESMSINSFRELTQTVADLLGNLVISSFVVERQPPQVIMTNKKFSTKVRFLIGNALNMNMTKPNVSVKLISEAQAQHIQKTNQCTESCGEIINDKGVMEYNETSKHLSLTFSNLQLNISKADRRRKCPSEKVVDKKFALLFQSTIPIGNSDHVYSIWAFSLPIVITVHVSQEPHAWATILWDNAFSEFNRIPFAVPEKVPWNRLGEALNMKFHSATDRYLTNENLHFLCEKALRMSVPFPVSDSHEITWTLFSKDNLPGRNFTFWEWLFDIMKLIRMHLRGPWNDGLIIGFMSRTLAEQYLICSQAGTFLLRFSETELGSITISLVNHSYKVFHLEPFTTEELKVRSLADSIRNFKYILFLYPNYPKGEVFGKFMSPIQVGSNYVPRGICAFIHENDNNNNI